jgi:replicative DNA helicase
MSEQRCAQRYVQSLLAIAKRSYEMRNMDLTLDGYGRVIEMKLDKLRGIWSLGDDNIATKIEKKLNRLMTPRLIIKQFPTGQLTPEMLEAYIENLQSNLRIRIGLLIVDYPDLMHMDAKYLRVETGKIYQMLRGFGIQYDMAVVAASQANRVGEGVTTLTRKHLAEDYSKVAISDNVVTYNQTYMERMLGLARIYVDKARNDITGDVVLITQNYNMAQFCLQSALIRGDYFQKLEKDFPNIINVDVKKNLSEGRKRLTRKHLANEEEE